MTRKQIRFLFGMSLLELAGLIGCIAISYQMEGNAPAATGLFGLLLLAASFTGSVYGLFFFKRFRENRERYGIVGTWLHGLVFLFLLILYGIGVILA